MIGWPDGRNTLKHADGGSHELARLTPRREGCVMNDMYYDRQGMPITETMAWAKKFEDLSYKRVAQTTLPNGRWVSTVWLGLNHQDGDGPPLIFETMVFPNAQDMQELDMDRYSTETEAMVGHAALCAKWEHEP